MIININILIIAGIYKCSECNHELFSSVQKFEHSSPWPSFTQPVHRDSLQKIKQGKNIYKVSSVIL